MRRMSSDLTPQQPVGDPTTPVEATVMIPPPRASVRTAGIVPGIGTGHTGTGSRAAAAVRRARSSSSRSPSRRRSSRSRPPIG